jgi:hypothetical protein
LRRDYRIAPTTNAQRNTKKERPDVGRSFCAPSELNSVPVHAVAGNAQINGFN